MIENRPRSRRGGRSLLSFADDSSGEGPHLRPSVLPGAATWRTALGRRTVRDVGVVLIDGAGSTGATRGACGASG